MKTFLRMNRKKSSERSILGKQTAGLVKELKTVEDERKREHNVW